MEKNRIIKFKRTPDPDKRPETLEDGEIALNLHDGNIYFKHSDNTIQGMRRFDERLDTIPVVNTIYDDNGDIIEVTYLTGNKVIYNYTDRDLTSADYYHVDGITVLYRQNILYDANGNIVGTEWIEL